MSAWSPLLLVLAFGGGLAAGLLVGVLTVDPVLAVWDWWRDRRQTRSYRRSARAYRRAHARRGDF